jgi:hypothetical protein
MLHTVSIKQEDFWIPGLPAEYQDPRIYPFNNSLFSVVRSDGRDRAFRLGDYASVARWAVGRKDTYVSQCFFRKENRQGQNLAMIDHAWLDLDTHKVTGYLIIDNEVGLVDAKLNAAFQILEFCDAISVPIPTSIFSSGRGYYLKWAFHQPIPAAAKDRFTALLENLIKRFSSLGADKAAKDTARILRFPGTINSKNDGIVRLLWPLNRYPLAYDFSALCDWVLPKTQAQIMEERAANENRPKGRGRGRTNWEWFNKARLDDLARLSILRGWDIDGVQEGQRDTVAWLKAALLAQTTEAADLPAVIQREVGDTIGDDIWSAKHLTGFTGSVLRRAQQAATGKLVEYNGKLFSPIYSIKTALLIDQLFITTEEQKEMFATIGPEEKARRRREKHAVEVAQREADKLALRRTAVEVYGTTGELPPGISAATVRRWRKQLGDGHERAPSTVKK